MQKSNKNKDQLVKEIEKLESKITKLKKSEKLQTVLYNIAEAVTTTKDLNTLYQTIHKSLEEIINVDNFYIAHYDDETKMLSFPFFVDSEDTPPGPQPLGKGLTEYVLKSGKALLLNKEEIIKYNKLGRIDIVGSVGEQWMGVPLVGESKIFGVIAVNSYKDPNKYDKEDLKIISFVSKQIAHVIEFKILTEQNEVERSYLEELFKSSPEAVALVTPESVILEINSQFAELFGYQPKEVIGKNIDELLVPRSFYDDALKTTKSVSLGKHEYFDTIRLKKDGTIVPVSVLGSPVKYKSNVVAVYAIYRDISERMKAKNKLAKSEKKYRELSSELAESNSMKELLLDIIAHDLKNPAGVIKGYAEMGLDFDKKNEILGEINHAADNLLRIIDNATTLSRITVGDSFEKWKVNITDMVNRLISEVAPLLDFEKMKIKMELESELIINANPIISEVFRNFISNAIKYAKSGKDIIIDSEENEKYLTVNVKDYGTTIDVKDRKKVFLRNVQLGKTKGRGLGLAIVKRIAEAHNAKVGVKPNEPKGNIFYIQFPK